MTPQAATVDETLSFAHRDGDAVRVRLRVPVGSVPDGPSAVRLSSGQRHFRVAADVTSDDSGVTVDFSAPGARLRRRVWSLELRPGSDRPAVPVQARLLARRDQPVALLPGPVPSTRLPAPRPPAETSLAQRAARHLPAPVKPVLRRVRAAARGRGA